MLRVHFISNKMDKQLSTDTETDNLIFVRVFVREIAVKIPSQKTHLGNLTCDFPDERSVPFWNPQVMHF